MQDTKWIKQKIRNTLDYQKIIKIVDEYLEKNDQEFLTKYQENDLDFIYISKPETTNIILIAMSYLEERFFINEKYQKMKAYILANHLKKLDLILSSLDEEDKLDIGLGFAFIEYSPLYQEKEVKDTFAKYFINKVLFQDKEKILTKIKETFKTEENFKSYGIKRYMIEYLSCFDIYLANYIAINPYLLSPKLFQTLNIPYNFKNQEETTQHSHSSKNKILFFSKK